MSAVRIALSRMNRDVALIEAEYQSGGWPGTDHEAKLAAALANRLNLMACAVALFGREYAEGEADEPWDES